MNCVLLFLFRTFFYKLAQNIPAVACCFTIDLFDLEITLIGFQQNFPYIVKHHSFWTLHQWRFFNNIFVDIVHDGPYGKCCPIYIFLLLHKLIVHSTLLIYLSLLHNLLLLPCVMPYFL